MVDLDGKCQSPKEPQVRMAITEQTIGNQPCLGTFLKGLQMFLNHLDLGGVARIGRIIELGHKLETVSDCFILGVGGWKRRTALASLMRSCASEAWPEPSIDMAETQRAVPVEGVW